MSCLFDSISYFLRIDSFQSRQKICDYLESNQEILSGIDTKLILNMEDPNYINKMRSTTTWGGALEIKAARNFYAFQGMIENVHGMTYALLLDTFVTNANRKEQLFNAIDTIPCIKNKADWALKWMNNERYFEERVIAFAVVEGIFFSASFASIFWLKSRNKMTKALGKSNELISRDEGLHCDFAVLVYNHLLNKVSQEKVEEIIREAVDIEIDFITQSIPCKMIGMNSELMIEYIMYVADRLLLQLGFNKIYYKENPFDFMKSFGLHGKTNFFESKVTDYVHSSTAKPTGDESWDFGY